MLFHYTNPITLCFPDNILFSLVQKFDTCKEVSLSFKKVSYSTVLAKLLILINTDSGRREFLLLEQESASKVY